MAAYHQVYDVTCRLTAFDWDQLLTLLSYDYGLLLPLHLFDFYWSVDWKIAHVVCSGNGKLASSCAIIGFIVMMSLDVGLG